jgi:hypothetical protein
MDNHVGSSTRKLLAFYGDVVIDTVAAVGKLFGV